MISESILSPLVFHVELFWTMEHASVSGWRAYSHTVPKGLDRTDSMQQGGHIVLLSPLEEIWAKSTPSSEHRGHYGAGEPLQVFFDRC